MDKGIGATLIVIGALIAWGAVHLWHAKKDAKAKGGWKETVSLLLVLAGLGIGGGIAVFFSLSFFYAKIGIVPVWTILAAIFGVWFLVDLLGRHGWTRTPVLGFLTAAMIAVPVAGPALAAMPSNGHAPQVTSVTSHHKG